MRKLKIALALGVGLAAVLAVLAGSAVHWTRQPLMVVEDVRVELVPGQSFAAFAADLAQQGLLERPRLWSAVARLTGDARKVQAGEYWVRVGDTPESLLRKLLTGDVAYYEVKLVEGWTVRQALAELARTRDLRHELAGADERTVLGALGLPEGHGEGLFFPDTYRFEKGASDADILRRAHAKLEAELDAIWVARDSGLPYRTPYEVLIVASLIEKETGSDQDRAKISQVFASRLRKGMRLQTDPSVIYGVGEEFDGNLTRRHLKSDTPYNTYTRKGLPPTPIALVGSKSLQAAAHPAGGDYLYFVSRGDGTSQFSVSLEEHQEAVRKYQLQ